MNKKGKKTVEFVAMEPIKEQLSDNSDPKQQTLSDTLSMAHTLSQYVTISHNKYI